MDGQDLEIDTIQAPTKRSDCINGPRPCPWVRCRYHLVWDVPYNVNRSDDELVDRIYAMPQTCALDVADDGEHTLEEVGELIGMTRERVRQIQDSRGNRGAQDRRVGAYQKLRRPPAMRIWGGHEYFGWEARV